jgi:hypothetical protein
MNIKNISYRSGKTNILELPFKRDPNYKLNVWQLMKDLIGKDISKFSVPV